MFLIDEAALARNAMRLCLEGKPTGSMGEDSFNRLMAEKVVDLDAARARLRPAVRDAVGNALFPEAG